MSLLLGFLGKNWRAIGLVLLIAFAGLQTARLAHAKGDLKTAKAALIDPATKRKWEIEAKERLRDLNTCRDNTTRLEGSIASQNAAVDRLKADGDARVEQATKAAQDALQARREADQTARKLAAYKSADTCPAREAGIAELVKGLKR
jgi:hypothetical protein